MSIELFYKCVVVFWELIPLHPSLCCVHTILRRPKPGASYPDLILKGALEQNPELPNSCRYECAISSLNKQQASIINSILKSQPNFDPGCASFLGPEEHLEHLGPSFLSLYIVWNCWASLKFARLLEWKLLAWLGLVPRVNYAVYCHSFLLC